MNKILTLSVLGLMGLLTGCVSTGINSVNVTTDQTFGNYQDELESNLILVTMTPEHHQRLTETTELLGEDQLPPLYEEFLERIQGRYELTRVADWPLAEIDIYCIVFENKSDRSRETLIASLDKELEIESAQPVQTFAVHSEEYNDPFLSLQHGIHSIQALKSHRWSRGAGVRVAVVDTGSDNEHPDLVSSTEITKNFVDRDEAGFRADVHGTAVGGIIAARANNETGMVGVAPEARLLALKACWYLAPKERGARCNSLTLAKALNFSISQSVDIINLSLAGPPDPLLERLVREALSRNIIVIGAESSENVRAFPVSVSGTIGVSMPDIQSNSLSAPGRRVLSTLPDEQYDFFDGSSFSTAHIAGLAAVIRSLAPDITPAELLDLLERTSDANTGVVNACRAVEALDLESDAIEVYDRCKS